MQSGSALSGVLFILATSVVACTSGSSDQADEGGAAISNPGSECSKAAYDGARSHYEQAVTTAKARLENRDGVCYDSSGTDTTLDNIAAHADAAVKACSDFKSIIASSDEAKPLREAMKGNLALASFDGRVTVAYGQERLVVSGLAQALSDGVTLWGPTPGAYGHISKIQFSAGNKAVLSELDIEVTPAAWHDADVSYAIGDANAKGVRITITDAAGKQTDYRLAPGSDNAFDFRMVPEDASNDEIFTAMPSECDA